MLSQFYTSWSLYIPYAKKVPTKSAKCANSRGISKKHVTSFEYIIMSMITSQLTHSLGSYFKMRLEALFIVLALCMRLYTVDAEEKVSKRLIKTFKKFNYSKNHDDFH